ncbi:hypothetical protein AVEN_258033-1 [Araneus ventricosus]|uniref:Uncharacterized protein n=1 Tax=Araneus ventricosus TaxID=182803 RepID=A0A4Y1ZV60_ARAVE|nr:hypothetical protein AVEN_258033-1 [Araneus ventricosus]
MLTTPYEFPYCSRHMFPMLYHHAYIGTGSQNGCLCLMIVYMIHICPTTKQVRKKGQMSILALPRSLKLGIIESVPVAFSLDDDEKVEDVLGKEKDEGINPTSLFRCLVIRGYLACDWMYSDFKNKITPMYLNFK